MGKSRKKAFFPQRLPRPLDEAHQANEPKFMPGTAECPVCVVRRETIEFLRDQLRQAQASNEQMQQKFLALAGDAADRFHKIQLTQIAQNSVTPANGMVRLDEAAQVDEMDFMLDEMMKRVHGGEQ